MLGQQKTKLTQVSGHKCEYLHFSHQNILSIVLDSDCSFRFESLFKSMVLWFTCKMSPQEACVSHINTWSLAGSAVLEYGTFRRWSSLEEVDL